MKFFQIRTYYNGALVHEGVTIRASNSREALERARDKFPEYSNCIMAAFPLDPEEHKEYIDTCFKLGCTF